MDLLLVLLIMALFSITNILCFVIGAKVGQKVTKGEEVELEFPKVINPSQLVSGHRVKKEEKMEQHKLETILRNIERYDGTPYGQEEVR